MPYKDKQAKADWQREYMVRYHKTHAKRKTLSVRPEPPVVRLFTHGVLDDFTPEGPLTKERQVRGFNKTKFTGAAAIAALLVGG